MAIYQRVESKDWVSSGDWSCNTSTNALRTGVVRVGEV